MNNNNRIQAQVKEAGWKWETQSLNPDLKEWGVAQGLTKRYNVILLK